MEGKSKNTCKSSEALWTENVSYGGKFNIYPDRQIELSFRELSPLCKY